MAEFTFSYDEVSAMMEIAAKLFENKNKIDDGAVIEGYLLTEDEIDTILTSNNIDTEIDDFMKDFSEFLPTKYELKNENGYWLS